MITKIEGREFKTKKRMKGWAGWAPVSASERATFQKLVLRPSSDRDVGVPCGIEEGDGLVLLQAAAAEIKATTTSSRNRNKFCVPEEIQRMTSDADKKAGTH